MARAVRKRKHVDTWKTKKIYNILAPRMFNEVKIAETLASNPSNVIGRTIVTDMKEISKDFSKQHIKLCFEICDVKGDNAYTKFTGHSLSRDYMRSQIRRKTTRVEGIVNAVTKDGTSLRIKTIALAIGRAQTAQERLLRKLMTDIVKDAASSMPLNNFIHDVVSGRISIKMYRSAGKIYPLKRVEVRKIKVLKHAPEVAE